MPLDPFEGGEVGNGENSGQRHAAERQRLTGPTVNDGDREEDQPRQHADRPGDVGRDHGGRSGRRRYRTGALGPLLVNAAIEIGGNPVGGEPVGAGDEQESGPERSAELNALQCTVGDDGQDDEQHRGGAESDEAQVVIGRRVRATLTGPIGRNAYKGALMILRYLTAGESHGKALIGILEGLPAGLKLAAGDIQADLMRRKKGHGRGNRQKIE